MDSLLFQPILQALALVLLGVLTMAIFDALEMNPRQRSWDIMFWTCLAYAVLNPILGFIDRAWYWVPFSLVCGAAVWFILQAVAPRIGREDAEFGDRGGLANAEDRVSFVPVLIWAGLSGLLVCTQIIIWIVGLIRKN